MGFRIEKQGISGHHQMCYRTSSVMNTRSLFNGSTTPPNRAPVMATWIITSRRTRSTMDCCHEAIKDTQEHRCNFS